MIRILYFARLREALGTDAETFALPAEVHTRDDLRARLSTRGPVWSSALAEDAAIMAAVNQAIARPDTPIHDGDKVALFPPVTGG
ncbi:molybdopterin converting factor subunit 1 [Thiocystis violacea]|uniref:molybdopterin converting factor subunit 1 n=1 Tax=Thiocystis violacea TaxID=13725 RepID=UPI0019087E84|nr:molybdopterin converting factor subunit 1 [Thiocystis violacea]MBK1724346.1 molybdopterin converting factor subunit 1 [Thiocystis violacea]